MDTFTSFQTRDFTNVFKTTDLSVRVQQHLQRVYAALMVTVLAAAAGTYFYMETHVEPFMGVLGTLGFMLALMWDSSRDLTKRMGFLVGFGFCKGISIGSLVEVSMFVDPSIVVTAFLGTAVVFLTFSGAALVAKRRSYLYLGATLGSVLTCMALASIVNWFVRIPFLFEAQLYLGLLSFCAYILFDTQMIVEKADRGDDDFVKHAMELFIDLVAIFVRILIILLKNSNKKDNRSSQRSNSRSNTARR